MAITVAIVRELIAAGLDNEALLAALERIASADFRGSSADSKTIDEQAERRRERDRLRKSAERLRKSAESPQIARVLYNTSNNLEFEPKNSPPPPSKPENPQTDGFEETWEAYPRKVSKGAARRAFKTALQKTSAPVVLAAVKAFAAKCAGTDEKFIPHFASWLNAERWQDADLSPTPRNGHCLVQVAVLEGSDAWQAWTRHRGRPPPVTDIREDGKPPRRGWYFPTEFPPPTPHKAA